MTDSPVADVLPLRPADAKGGTAPEPNAHHARTREGKAPRVPPWAAVAGVMQGASVIGSPPPAILTVWSRHVVSAKFYKHRLVRWPRIAFGAAHTWLIVAPAYFLAWATDSPPRLIAVLAVTLTTLALLHVI
jgi:hypothetical protein